MGLLSSAFSTLNLLRVRGRAILFVLSQPCLTYMGGVAVSHSLYAFVTKTLQRNRISFADVRRLKRNVLPAGITSRLEVEVLIALDRTIERTGREWSDFLVAAVTEFVVWGSHPPGCLDQATADWVVAALNCGRPKTVRAIASAIVRDAQLTDEVLLAFAEGTNLRGKAARIRQECGAV